MKYDFFNFRHTPEKTELHAVRIFEARLKQRGVQPAPGFEITVIRNDACAPEEFRLSGARDSKKLQLDCGSAAAFLYAVGKILRTGNYNGTLFTPGVIRGNWVPEKSFRGIYLASHFYNVYEVAPVEMIEEYLEDLALRGYNVLELSPGSAAKIANSPEAAADLERRKRFWKYASELGMKLYIYISNHGYDDSPQEIRAVPTGHSFFGTEICPGKPEGMAYLLDKFRNDFEEIKDIDVAFVQFWPYDQGGCKCEKCFPYGANGMFKLAEKTVPLIREYWPEAEIVWATWEFDWKGEDLGEWSTLYEKLNQGKADFITHIMADSHGSFPEYPLKHPLPANVKLITFPEISMWGRAPWGGYGATPLPERFSALFGEISHISSGGILYSEGIFEDFNKVLYADMFFTGKNDTAETFREYACYDLGLPENSLDDFKRFLCILEENHEGVIWLEELSTPCDLFDRMKSKPVWRLKGKKWQNTQEMLDLAEKLDKQLPSWAKNSWRWRLLYLRAVIDFQFALHDNETNEITEKAMIEIAEIYCVSPRTASRRVTPFTDEWLKYHTKEKFVFNKKTIGVD